VIGGPSVAAVTHPLDISDRIVMVTGAARGIGRAVAVGLADLGARVVVLTRNAATAEEVAGEITRRRGAGRALAVVADVTDEEQVAAAVARVDAHWGRLDGLINNAGAMVTGRPVLDMDAAEFRSLLETNLVSAFLVTRHAAPLIIRGGGGRIVYMSSKGAVQSLAGASAYGASKAGMNILSNVVHQELADQGIRTVAVAPGLTDTPGMREVAGADHIARVAATYPGGRVGQPEDLVGLCAYLCSDAGTHLSGTFVMMRP
jgi:NAD(P)-dependent dehydrogenase (short-subunit alcohol dehydrogenase family)